MGACRVPIEMHAKHIMKCAVLFMLHYGCCILQKLYNMVYMLWYVVDVCASHMYHVDW